MANKPGEQTLIQCCGYTRAQGVPAPWECPGCHTVHNADAPPPSTQVKPEGGSE